jgi:hypothetical protein
MEQRPQQPGDAKQHTPMMAQYLGHTRVRQFETPNCPSVQLNQALSSEIRVVV